jgi:hypothetical protein
MTLVQRIGVLQRLINVVSTKTKTDNLRTL